MRWIYYWSYVLLLSVGRLHFVSKEAKRHKRTTRNSCAEIIQIPQMSRAQICWVWSGHHTDLFSCCSPGRNMTESPASSRTVKVWNLTSRCQKSDWRFLRGQSRERQKILVTSILFLSSVGGHTLLCTQSSVLSWCEKCEHWIHHQEKRVCA